MFKARLSALLYLPLVPLLPLIIAQGKRVKRDTVRLPEPSGIAVGTSEKGEFSLIHIGESTVAGIGVDDIQQGLTAAIQRHSRNCSGWHSVGRNGYTVGDILSSDDLLPRISDEKPVCVLLTFGVNDTTRFTTLSDWQQHLQQLVSKLPEPALVACTRVPAMQQFPALPKPLNFFLGLRAWQLNQVLVATCRQNGWHHISTPMKITSDKMARDGYHPNAAGYDLWGQDIAATIDHIFSGGKAE